MTITDKSELKTGKVLVEFWAEWCGPCKMLKPVVETFSNENDNVKVYFCNVDDDSEMASAFGVRSIPTMVYMEDGEVKGRKVGVVPPAVIEELVNS
jgi:thioredoxin 1